MKSPSYLILFFLLFTVGCARSHVSETDIAGFESGEKGALRVRLDTTNDAYKFYEFKTIILARVDPKTRIISLLDANGKMDEHNYGYLRFETPGALSFGSGKKEAQAYLYPGYYAPVLLDLYSPGVHASTISNIDTRLPTASENAKRKDAALVRSLAATPGISQSLDVSQPKNIHSKRLVSSAPIWQVMPGKTLDVGLIRLNDVVEKSFIENTAPAR
jgi:hypothetical protein